MSLNHAEVDKIIEELDIENAFIQTIKQPDFKHLILEVYKPGKATTLILSLVQQYTRLHATEKKYKSLKKPPRFAQYMRANIQGSKIKSVKQYGQERIVVMELTRGGSIEKLYFRLWNNAVNVIHCDENDIIKDALLRRPKKNETPGNKFTLPERCENNKTSFEVRDYPHDISFNEFIDNYYYQLENENDHDEILNRLQSMLRKNLAGLQVLADKLEKKLDTPRDDETFKHYGDLLYANVHKHTKGSSEIELEDYNNPGTFLKISLNPKLSIQENADDYYKKHRKNRSGHAEVEEELENVKSRILRLQEEFDSLNNLSTDELKDLLDSEKQDSQKTGKTPAPGLRFHSGGFTILVGRNARENDALLRKHTRGNDYWLHTRDYPGGYIFIKCIKGKTVPLEVLLDAGNLAVHYSKAKANGKAEVYYTQVKYLRRAKHGKLGLVIPTQEKNLSVKLDSSRMQRLLDR